MVRKCSVILFGLFLFILFSFKALMHPNLGGEYILDLNYKFIDLFLNTDSTFKVTDSRWTKSGNWQVINDTLFLEYLKIECHANDCEFELGDTNKIFDKYIIEGDYLHPARFYDIKRHKFSSYRRSFRKPHVRNGVYKRKLNNSDGKLNLRDIWRNDTLIRIDTISVRRKK